MEARVYRAFQSGKWDAINGILTDAYNQRTANGNTVLHLLAQFSCDFPEEAAEHILSHGRSVGSDMAVQANKEGETPLHIASRGGHSKIVQVLVDFQGAGSSSSDGKRLVKMLGAVDRHGNTAIHVAVSNKQYDVVDLLLQRTPDELSYVGNSDGECPLYIAIDKRCHDIAELILKLCRSSSYHGPEGKTALHAAIVRNSRVCTDLIWENVPLIRKEGDAMGWTALHYAAKNNNENAVKHLLTKDTSLGYIAANADDSITVLHVAATCGHINLVREIVSRCPNSRSMITWKRKNILHLAVENEHQQVLNFILESPWASELINEQDHMGNTPLHLYTSTKKLRGRNLVDHPRVHMNLFNHDGFTPMGIIAREEPYVHSRRETVIKKELKRAGATVGLLHIITRLDETMSNGMRDLIRHPDTPLATDTLRNLQSYMVVATLVVTVAFGAGFKVPGGYNTKSGNTGPAGLAILSRNSAFGTFIVTDSLALMFACTAVFLQIMVMNKKYRSLKLFHYSKLILILAIAFLMAAFIAGVYAVVPVPGLRIYLVLFGCLLGVCLIFFSAVALLWLINAREEEEPNARNA